MKFLTLNSEYTIDEKAMTWARVPRPGRTPGPLLAEGGPLTVLPDPVVGLRCILTEGALGLHEVVYTSQVVEVLEGEAP